MQATVSPGTDLKQEKELTLIKVEDLLNKVVNLKRCPRFSEKKT
jgi:hypothetical protein